MNISYSQEFLKGLKCKPLVYDKVFFRNGIDCTLLFGTQCYLVGDNGVGMRYVLKNNNYEYTIRLEHNKTVMLSLVDLKYLISINLAEYFI